MLLARGNSCTRATRARATEPSLSVGDPAAPFAPWPQAEEQTTVCAPRVAPHVEEQTVHCARALAPAHAGTTTAEHRFYAAGTPSPVEEQTGILLNLLSALGELLGTPYAELLWCQAVACVAFALVSEMVYTSVLGLVAGSIIGFFRGYVIALTASASVAAQGLSRGLSAGRALAKAAGLALRMPWVALRGLSLFAARTLPVRIL
ncbi:hypothetical protein TSOC_002937 [Tetrabaena socialis]|uniref:Uncharacterized protein n=1 Tax=Tetrabaena socialis TaxID=47790 RepID=A0A2J8ACV5_9CHLO|nr:hypothetical protein TSOC_002937 [Tetrabaena socialis]|eukprot:PNH10355.1 hypothetical protein TSOC_002937 [Tetrabaena socialis]